MDTVVRDVERPPRTGIGYQPALDGLRALAVVMVLLFHGDVSWMGGGYFGVSIFFTLSGFLITSLLVREFDDSGRIATGAFYTRRIKRLLPASVVCLAAVCVLGALDVWRGVDHLRRDVLGAAFQVANWVQLFAGESYTDLQSSRAGIVSPLDHYWSLAIEEQFYWIWPLAFVVLARIARRFGWRLTTVLGGLTLVFAAAAPVIAAVWGRDAAYWATPARAAEILVGGWLAVAVASGRIRPRRWMAPAAGATVVVVAVTLPAASGPAYHGAFALLAVPSAILLLGLQAPGVVTSALASRPLVALGRISYGVYLYHFPIFVLMSINRTGLSGPALLGARLTVTVAVALISSWLVERPIRFGNLSGARSAVWSAVATAAICGLVLALPTGSATYYTPDPDLVSAAGIQPVDDTSPTDTSPTDTSTTDTSPVDTPTTTDTIADVPASSPAALVSDDPAARVAAVDVVPSLNRPARILLVGDSTAEALGAGLVAWAVDNPTLAQVSLDVVSGCGFVRGGTVPSDGEVPFQSNCDRVLDELLPVDLVELQPDVVVLMVTSRDIVPRQWIEVGEPIDPSDERFVEHMRADYQDITDLVVSTTGARIVWVRPPQVDPYWLGQPHPFIDPELLSIREGVMFDTVAANSDRSQLLDLRAWVELDGIAVDQDARPDGLHFTTDAAQYVAEQWLGPQLVVAAAANAADQQAVDQQAVDQHALDSGR